MFKICELWSCDMNSTLGSVVPLAMFWSFSSLLTSTNVLQWLTFIDIIYGHYSFIGISQSILDTSYVKWIDVWMVFVLMVPFLEASVSNESPQKLTYPWKPLFLSIDCACCKVIFLAVRHYAGSKNEEQDVKQKEGHTVSCSWFKSILWMKKVLKRELFQHHRCSFGRNSLRRGMTHPSVCPIHLPYSINLLKPIMCYISEAH